MYAIFLPALFLQSTTILQIAFEITAVRLIVPNGRCFSLACKKKGCYSFVAMRQPIRQLLKRELHSFLQLKQTERLWHIPVLASLCVGIPLLIGFFTNRLDYGILSSTGGMVILYLPSSTSLAKRMITLVVCSFGLTFSFAVSIVFSFHPLASALVLGIIAFSAYWVTEYFEMKAPGSFFFIMIASIAGSMKFDLMTIPTRLGLLVMSGMLACVLAFLYSLYITRKQTEPPPPIVFQKSRYSKLVEALITGLVLMGSVVAGYLLNLEKPYWVPISCAAVMQGASMRHIWQRSFQRILGTFVGLGLTFLLLQLKMTPLIICISIIILQFIVEMIVVRHYALAVVFITPLTLLLAEAGSTMTANPQLLISTRLQDIVVGSLIGAVGGWMLHHQQLLNNAERKIRKTRIAILRR